MEFLCHHIQKILNQKPIQFGNIVKKLKSEKFKIYNVSYPLKGQFKMFYDFKWYYSKIYRKKEQKECCYSQIIFFDWLGIKI
jgi:hypothetical protein